MSAAEVASLAPLPGSAVKDSFQDVDLAAEGYGLIAGAVGARGEVVRASRCKPGAVAPL